MRQTRTGQNRLTVDDLGDMDAVSVTIDGARTQSFSNNYLSNDNQKVVLTFKEYGDAEYVLNATSFHRLADRYGRDYNTWVGKPCVLVPAETDDPRTGAKVQSVWVASPMQWAEAERALRTAATSKPRKRAGK